MRNGLCLGLCSALVLVCLARDASAQMSNEMRAEQLFRSGEKKFDSGKYAEACQDFKESLRLGPKLGTLLNLALCHETVGKPATAWGEYHHAAAWAAQNNQKDRHDFALQHAVQLETKLPRVVLHLPTETAIATVDVDGEPLVDSRWYLPIFLDPGEHSVAISAPGKQRSTVKFRVTQSPMEQLVSIPSLSDDNGAAPQPGAPVTQDSNSSRRLAGIVTMGVGGAALLFGITYGIIAVGTLGDCADPGCVDDAKSQVTIATVATVAGAVATAAGGYLFFTSQGPGPRAGLGVRGTELGVFGTF